MRGLSTDPSPEVPWHSMQVLKNLEFEVDVLFQTARLGRSTAKWSASLPASASSMLRVTILMIGLPRMPSRYAFICALKYSAFWPARLGDLGCGLLPFGPWQPIQTSGFVLLDGGSLAKSEGWKIIRVATRVKIIGVILISFIGKLHTTTDTATSSRPRYRFCQFDFR